MVSPALISKVTDAVMEQVVEWQNRPLDAVYPIVYLDCIVLKVRQDSHIINKSVFLALGINIVNAKIIGRFGDADDFLDSQEIKHVY